MTVFENPSQLPTIRFGSGGTLMTTSIEEDQVRPKPVIHLTDDRLVSITFEEGFYDYFILDNSGRQLSRGTLSQIQGNTTHDLLRNINTSFGMYYIVLVNSKTGSFTSSKLLIP